MQAEDLKRGRISIDECSRIQDIVKRQPMSKALTILNESFTALFQSKYDSNWDPTSENVSASKIREWSTQIFRVL